MSELDEFRAIYFDECSELLTALEEEFFEIEQGDRSEDRLNAVFRAIHSIKGGAGAFNFTQLVEFAHSYETLLDFVRDGRLELTDEIVALCIRSNDLVADFVGAARDAIDLSSDHGAEELARFKAVCAEHGGEDETMEEFDIEFTPVMVDLGSEQDQITPEQDEALPPVTISGGADDFDDAEDSFELAPMQDQAPEAEQDFVEDQAGGAPSQERPAVGWKVNFTPFSTLYQRANDPMLLLRELAGLGTLHVRAELHELPDLLEFDPFGVYCVWEMMLDAPDVTEAQIHEVFEFVEGDCEITVTQVASDVGADNIGELREDISAVSEAELQVPDLSQSPEETASLDALVPDAAELVELVPEQIDDAPSFADLAAEIAPPAKESASATSDTDVQKTESDADSKPKTGAPAKAVAAQSIRVDLEKVDRVVNMVGELVITQSMITQQMDDNLKSRYQELVRGVEVLEQTTRGLQDSVMSIRAQPVKSVFSRMPRLVRELATKTGKKIKLEMVGENTEIDKTIIEQLSDPLVHMIRNSADHGVEQAEERIAAGKPEVGVIRLSAEQSGGNILISVEDDGAGVNRPKVLALAKERGVVGPDQQITDEQVDELIFAPGFSTAEALSDISGRGVGMDVVISNIKKIGGSVHVKSWPGKGTRMQLRLPLTLAVLDVMLVRVGETPYVIPLSSIVETMQGARADFGRAPSGRRVLQVRGEYVQVVDLAERFAMESSVPDDKRFVVLCECDGRVKVGVIVDDIIGQQQVVIKSLEENFERINGIAGGTILGDGNVALIVDVQGVKNEVEQKVAA